MADKKHYTHKSKKKQHGESQQYLMWYREGYDGDKELGGLESGVWTTGEMVYPRARILRGRLGGKEEQAV